MPEEKLVGKVTHIYSQIQVAIIDLAAPLKVGQTVHFKGSKDDFNQVITQMQFEHQNIDAGKKGQQVGVKTEQPVHENDQVFVVT